MSDENSDSTNPRNGNGNGVLDLNALYGVERPLKVLWGDREYFLRRPQEMGPRDVVTLQHWSGRAQAIQNLDMEHLTEAQANELERVTREMSNLICPDLATVQIPFVALGKIITWYFAEVNPEKKIAAAAKTTENQSQ